MVSSQQGLRQLMTTARVSLPWKQTHPASGAWRPHREPPGAIFQLETLDKSWKPFISQLERSNHPSPPSPIPNSTACQAPTMKLSSKRSLLLGEVGVAMVKVHYIHVRHSQRINQILSLKKWWGGGTTFHPWGPEECLCPHVCLPLTTESRSREPFSGIQAVLADLILDLSCPIFVYGG